MYERTHSMTSEKGDVYLDEAGKRSKPRGRPKDALLSRLRTSLKLVSQSDRWCGVASPAKDGLSLD